MVDLKINVIKRDGRLKDFDYRRISDAIDKAYLEVYGHKCGIDLEDDITDEIIDRFGNMPSEIENLLDIARIKYMAKSLYITKIASKKTAVVFTFEQSKFDVDIPKLVSIYKNRLKFSPGVKPMITLDIGTTNERQILNDVAEFLKQLEK